MAIQLMAQGKVSQFRVGGYEADDIIGSLAKYAEKNNIELTVYKKARPETF